MFNVIAAGLGKQYRDALLGKIKVIRAVKTASFGMFFRGYNTLLSVSVFAQIVFHL